MLAILGQASTGMTESCWAVVLVFLSPRGRVHRSVRGSLLPRRISFPLNVTMHLLLSKVTVQPTSLRHYLSVRLEKLCLASQELAKMSFFFYPCGHIKVPALEHTMAQNLPTHTGVNAAAAIKLSALVPSHMHGQCLMCLV